jgi:hypothetical protein
MRAQRHALARRDRPEALEVRVGERDGLHVDVERVDGALGRQRVDLVHPRVGVPAGRDGVGEQASDGDALPQRPGQPHQPGLRLAGEPVAGLGLQRRRAGGEHLARDPPGLREHGVVARLGQRPGGGRDAAAGARDLLVRHAGHLHLVLLRAPASEGQVRVAVDEPRQDRPAGRVDPHGGARVVVERGDHAVAHADRARLQPQLARPVAPQVRQPVLRREQDLRGTEHGQAHRIGIRMP